MEKVYRATAEGIIELTGEELAEHLAYCASAQAEQKAVFINSARDKRNGFLLQSDWIELPSCRLSDAKKQEWATYRQALRDVPQQPGFPDNIQWPTKPE